MAHCNTYISIDVYILFHIYIIYICMRVQSDIYIYIHDMTCDDII